ncbi:hypothetical protein J4221_02110 [Candidatus Pacearchaeota archaeon]|nr:hypothetical protein [Candidatus Pacearchaeota archaeon]
MEKIKLCDGCLNNGATKCCKKCNECYCDECIILHHEKKHMKKHSRKLRAKPLT